MRTDFGEWWTTNMITPFQYNSRSQSRQSSPQTRRNTKPPSGRPKERAAAAQAIKKMRSSSGSGSGSGRRSMRDDDSDDDSDSDGAFQPTKRSRKLSWRANYLMNIAPSDIRRAHVVTIADAMGVCLK